MILGSIDFSNVPSAAIMFIVFAIMSVFAIGSMVLVVQKHRYDSFLRKPIGWTVTFHGIFYGNEGVITEYKDGIAHVIEKGYTTYHDIKELIPIKKPKLK